uniref:ATP synthase subunit a n=1 Tax=Hanleyella oldroydi TaxID=515356 RepID=A0A6H1PG58_9MOLL|nr:ATP synthase F0 subunit 6 [Hanleyella oldroydi]QIZ12609.1 ATP synthase F0 subunit 6 [Hanleyella oldroydi]
MLVDIFSAFDEHNFTFFSMTLFMWLMAFFPLLLLQSSFWCHPSRWEASFLAPKNFISMQVFRSFGLKLSGFLGIVCSLFLLLIIFNLTGLFPYVFSVTSHLIFSFSLAFPFWLSLICSGVIFNPSEVAAHLLPSGAPAVLNPFLVLIETVSISVRPVTLCVRLTANMSAGHIILGLIGTYLSSGIFMYSGVTVGLLVIVQIFYFLFEIGICMIQAYIFCLLVILYSDDHPDSQ